MSSHQSMRTQDELVRGERVVALMWPRRISQARLASAIGVDPSSFSQKLRGKRPWYLREVTQLAIELNTTVAYLIGESDEVRPVDGSENGVGRTGLEPVTDGL
ncbi:MAG: hypothetical protein CMF57_08405 [Leifsonia sp.]|jgi:transcriptional regulator with XRE-family HTH domain|nr:hypothetical protein [Leifsonia sp.]MBX9639054.1 hypothetical protein [Mycobacteriaceae bacterium]